MFKKISTIVALLAMTLTGVGIQPASATATGSNSGAYNMISHVVNIKKVTTSSTDRTFTVAVPEKAISVKFMAKFLLSPQAQARLAANGGTTMVSSLTATGPSGQNIPINNSYSNSTYAYGFYQWNHLNSYENSATKLINVAASSESFAYMNLQLGDVNSSFGLAAGTYTFTVSLKANGTEVTPEIYNAANDSIGLVQGDVQLAVTGQPTVAYPSGAVTLPESNICLDTSLVSVGDELKVRHYLAGTQVVASTPQEATQTSWVRRSDPLVGLGNLTTRPQWGPTPPTFETYTVTASDITSGVKIVPQFETGSALKSIVADGSTIQTYDLSLYNETTGVEVSKACMPTLAKPTLNLTSRTGFQATINTSNLAAGANIYGNLYKASDSNTVVATCNGYLPVAANTATCNGSLNSPGLDLSTDYIVKVRARSNNDGYGPYSVQSDPAQVTGPAAPTSPPALSRQSISSAVLTFEPVATATRYEVKFYKSTDLNTVVYSDTCTSNSSCLIQTNNLFVAPDSYVAKYAGINSNNLTGGFSPASNAVEGLYPGTTLNTQPSGATTAGKTRISTPNLGSILASTASNLATGSDGRGGLLYVSRSISSANNNSTFVFGRIKNDADALDSSIGGGTPLSWTVSNVVAGEIGAPAYFGSNKSSWAQLLDANGSFYLTEGTFASASVTTRSPNFDTFCATNSEAGASSGIVQIVGAPTARPVILLSCQKSAISSFTESLFAARYEADGSLTSLGRLTQSASTSFEKSSSPEGVTIGFSVNLVATGSETAILVPVVGTKRSTTADPNDPTYYPTIPDTRKLIRIPANVAVAGDVTSADLGINEGSTEQDLPELSIASNNDGTTVYLIATTTTMGQCTGTPPFMNCPPPSMSNKLYSAQVSSGSFGTVKAVSFPVGVSSSNASIYFNDGYFPNATSGGVTEVAIGIDLRTCTPNNGCTFQSGLGRIITSTGAVAYNELISTSTTGSPVDLIWLNNSGNLKHLITEPNATGHKILETKSLLGYIAVAPTVVPTVTGLSEYSSADGGGATITLIGTNLTMVTKVQFGAVQIIPTKTATTLTFKVPNKVAAGGTSSVAVSVKYGVTGSVALPRPFNYIGAVKFAQSIDVTSISGLAQFNVGDPDRILITSSKYNDDGAATWDHDNNPSTPEVATPEVATNLQVSVASKSATICTVTQGLLHFIAAGTCVIEASQAGNGAFAAASKLTKNIYVVPDYDGASALYSTDAGKPTITLNGTGLTSVTSVKIGDQVVTGSNIKANATGTQLTLKVPAKDVANTNTDLKLVWGATNTVVDTQDDFVFVGVNKLNQVLTFTTSSTATFGDSMRSFSTNSNSPNVLLSRDALHNQVADPALDVLISLKSTTPNVCSAVGNDIRFLTAGTCSVVASQAGNAGLNKATDVTQNITVAKKAQTITLASTTLSMTDAVPVSAGATLSSEDDMDIEYSSNNEDVCSVDASGIITGLQATTGLLTCVITAAQAGDTRYSAAQPQTVTVTIASPSDVVIPDQATAETDGVLSPVSIVAGGANTYTATNDSGFELSWDKAAGKLVPRAKGVYTGYILAKISFTKAGITYTCTNVFGSNAAMKNVKPADKKAAKALKTFTTKNAFCADKAEIKPSLFTAVTGGLSRANFAKIKPANNANKVSVVIPGPPAVTKYESDAAAQLKGLTAPLTVTIEITRFRTWPTTGVNYTGDKSKVAGGKKIPVTKRTTVVRLPN